MEKWSQERLDKFSSLLEEGKGLGEIASYFNINYSNAKYLKSHYRLGEKIVCRAKSVLEKKVGDVKAQDLAKRIMFLRGESVRTEEVVFGFDDDKLKTWFFGVEGFSKFCIDVLKVELQSYQLQMAEMMLKSKRTCFVLGRQSGKDFTISCFVLWLCIVHSNERVLLVSASQRQSDLLFSRIMQFIANSNELFDSVSKSNLEVIVFSNGSDVYSLPASGQIRGYTEVSWIFVNEAAHGVTEENLQALEPMLAIRHGSLVLMSSPAGTSGVFWNAFNSPMYAKLQLPSSVNKFISPKWILEQQKTMSSIGYETEILAHFSEAIDSFFKIETINAVSKEYSLRQTCPHEQGMTYYCGIEWGRIGDSSAIVILSKSEKDKLLKVENIIEMRNTPFKIQEERIKALHKDWNFKKICAEKAGLSINSCENLLRDGLPLANFIPTLDNKAEAYNFLLKSMEDELITIPKHDKLQFELRSFKFQMTSNGRMMLHHQLGGSDDFPDALCFACWATKVSGGAFFIAEW